MDETHVAQIKLLEGAKRAAELGQFLLKLENSISTIHHKQLVVNLARAVLAVSEPVEPVVHLAVPRAIALPCQLLHISEQVEAEVDAKR